MVKIEGQPLTLKQWQYWGGFMVTLDLQISHSRRWSPGTLKTESPNAIYYYSSVEIHDGRKLVVEQIGRSFGGGIWKINKGLPHNPTWIWGLTNTDDKIAFLESIRPYLPYTGNYVSVVLDFLRYKQERIEQYKVLGNAQAVPKEERMEEEERLLEAFRQEKRRPLSKSLQLPPNPTLAGMFEAEGSIFLGQVNKQTGYTTRILFPSRNLSLLEVLKDKYHGCKPHLNQERSSDRVAHPKYIWEIKGKNAQTFLQDIEPDLILLKPQARLAINFENIQTVLDKTGKTLGARHLLAQALINYSTENADLISFIREGFYQAMKKLN